MHVKFRIVITVSVAEGWCILYSLGAPQYPLARHWPITETKSGGLKNLTASALWSAVLQVKSQEEYTTGLVQPNKET